MKTDFEWDVKYTLEVLTRDADKVEHIRKKLLEVPQKELTFEDHWALREYMQSVRIHVDMLRKSQEEYLDEQSKNDRWKFWRK